MIITDEELQVAFNEIAEITASHLSSDDNRKTLIKMLVLQSIHVFEGKMKYTVNGYRTDRERFLEDLKNKYSFLMDGNYESEITDPQNP